MANNIPGTDYPMFFGSNEQVVKDRYRQWAAEKDKKTREEEAPKIEPRLRAMRALLFQSSLDRTGGVRDGQARNPNQGIDLSRLQELAKDELYKREGLRYSDPTEIPDLSARGEKKSAFDRAFSQSGLGRLGQAYLDSLNPINLLDPRKTLFGPFGNQGNEFLGGAKKSAGVDGIKDNLNPFKRMRLF